MSALSIDDLRCPPPLLKAIKVAVPEFGADCETFIAELSANERDMRIGIWFGEYQAIRGDDTNVGLTAWVVAASFCDESRKFLAADAAGVREAADLLGRYGCGLVSRLFAVSQEANAIGAEQAEALEKN